MKKRYDTIRSVLFHLLGFDSAKKVPWSNVPKDLREQVAFFSISGIVFIILNTFFALKSIGNSNTMFYTMLVGIFIGICILLYAMYLKAKFTHQNYVKITGVCTDISSDVLLTLKKQICILFKDSRNITYQVLLNSKKNTYIRIGDVINIYLPDEQSYYEKDGVYIVARFYSVKKESISKQLESANST